MYNILKLLQFIGDFITENKIKHLTKEQLIISIDRLTRFKNTEDKYLRVFKDVILSNLIEPKFKRKDLDEMNYALLRDYAQNIINLSIDEICQNNTLKENKKNDLIINNELFEYENSIFNFSDDVKILLKNEINYNKFIQLVDDNSVINLKWLKSLATDEKTTDTTDFRFPIKLVVIAEGITEETLLPIFAKKCDYDFDKNGIQIVSAGGKNQVVKSFYTLSEQLKIPIFILLDNDAKENYEQIVPKLRSFDKIHLLNCGEFEDILPKQLILNTLNDHFINLNSIDESEFTEERMVLNLEEIFKKKGFHEFKKAEFAQLIRDHVKHNEDISPEIREIVNEISVCRSYALQ